MNKRVKIPGIGMVCLDRFDTTLDIPKSRRTYDVIKQRVLQAGRFSIFEATGDNLNARLFTKLHDDPELVVDNTREYPWFYVRRAEADSGTPEQHLPTAASDVAQK